MLDKNKIFGGVLGISHFFTDAIASFVLVSLSLVFLAENSSFKFGLFFYFMLYNFIAFGGQSLIGYFLDKVEKSKKSFKISKNLILVSFLFYLLGLLIFILNKNSLGEKYYIFSVFLVGLGSAFFHIGGGNISLLSKKKKATVLGLFASGGVVGLSFGYFMAKFYFDLNYLFFIVLLFLGFIIYFWKNYKLEKDSIYKNSLSTEGFSPLNKKDVFAKHLYSFGKKDVSEKHLYILTNVFAKHFYKILIFFLFFILAFRSAIWTNYQYVFFDEKMIIFYLAISAFLGKIIGGFLEDLKFFKDKYFLITGFLSIIFIIIHSFFYQNLFLVLAGIFGLTLFISPVTIILNKIFYRKKAIIISYSFGLSLILGYFLYLFFS